MDIDDLGRVRAPRGRHAGPTVAEAALQQVDTVYQLDFRRIPLFGSTPFVGRTGSGKTAAMMEMAYHQRHAYDIAMVFCDSADDAAEYARRFPGAFIYDSWQPDRLQALYDAQQDNTRRGIDTAALVIIEDFGYDRKVWTAGIVRRVHNNGRHARIRLLYSVQSPKTIEPALRSQVSWVVIAYEKAPQYREKIYEAFNPMFRTFAEFDRTMAICTTNHRCMAMFMLQGGSDALCDNVFWYQPAFPMRMFRIPSERRNRAAWAFHQRHLRTPRLPMATAGGVPRVIAVPHVHGRTVTSAVRGAEARAPNTVQMLSTVRALVRLREAAAARRRGQRRAKAKASQP